MTNLTIPDDFFDEYPSIDAKQRLAIEQIASRSMLVLTGGPGCLAGDTVINVESEARRGCGGRPYTIADAYHKFNGIPRKQRGGKRFWSGKVFTLSLFLDGGINYNQIVNIIFSGRKEVFEVTSESGRKLLATSDHPFLTPDKNEGEEGYVKLADLTVGSRIVCRRTESRPSKSPGRNTDHRQELHVPYHPFARSKNVSATVSRINRSKKKSYQYKLIRTARLVVEANLNKMTLDEYVNRLQTTSDNLIFLDADVEIHHANGNVTNNALSNLIPMTRAEHAKEHGHQNRKHFGNQTSEVDKIVSIVSKGVQDTYDLVMAEPARNFVANGFIVHNCGKTFTTNLILDLFEQNGLRTICCAPTGKAAIRMTELTKRPATTIHRALESTGINFKRHSGNPIQADAVIIDEASMIDAELFAALLNAIPLQARIVIVGDVDQLPSIGPGRVFYDMIESGRVPVVRLTTIFRQASDSRIPYVAREVNTGILPDLKSRERTDFAWSEVENDKDAAVLQQLIVNAVTTIVPENRGIPSDRIQVLCPQHKTEIGCVSLNNALQQALNPNWSPDKKAGLIAGQGCRLFPGDRVIHANKNNYDLEVANGEIGKVIYANFKPMSIPADVCKRSGSTMARLIIDFGDRKVAFEDRDIMNVELAYAITIHKSQGSSFEAIVMPIHSENKFMLTRPLVYTAMTRAEKLLVMLGETEAFSKAVTNTRGTERRTNLREMLVNNRE